MKFGPLHKAHFKADEGAYSIVTPREAYDRQLTATGLEYDIITSCLGISSIPRGAIKGRKQSIKVIGKDGQERIGEIPVNFPKGSGNELRVYQAVRYGFRIASGDVWFTFRRGRKLAVGCMPLKEWRVIGTRDPADEDFQKAVQSGDTQILYTNFSGMRVARNPSVSRQAIADSGYKCAYTGEPTPFLSRVTGKPYLEVHHLIPLWLQIQFSEPLDVTENVLVLNPLWHRAIHHAEQKTVLNIVERISGRCPDTLERFGVSRNDLLAIYGCEEITKEA